MSLRSPYLWVPTLYFAEGAPASIIGDASLIIFKNLGMADSYNIMLKNMIGLLPILIVKLLGGPLVDSTGTKRMWIISMQFAMSLVFIIASGMCMISAPVMFLVGLFMLVGFLSASHDVAADGFYIIALPEYEQALFSGLRSVFFRIAMLAANGGLVMLAGIMMAPEKDGGFMLPPGNSWGLALLLPALILGAFAIWHFYVLPKEQGRKTHETKNNVVRSFGGVFVSFFTKKHIGVALVFILLYRLAEAQIGDVSRLFLLNADGIGMTTVRYGYLAGTVGVAMMLAGGVAAGFLVARFGMGKMLWPMVLAINLPDLLYVLLAFMPSGDELTIGAVISIEQFGYGFGFTGFMLFMVWFASTSMEAKTSHYALLTFFMIAGLRLPAMVSGMILENIVSWTNAIVSTSMTRYQLFFIWVTVCTIPGYFVTWLASRIIDPAYGLKKQ